MALPDIKKHRRKRTLPYAVNSPQKTCIQPQFSLEIGQKHGNRSLIGPIIIAKFSDAIFFRTGR